MGLLTDARLQHKAALAVWSWRPLLGWTFLLVSVGWVLVLPHPQLPFVRQFYADENSMLIGLAAPDFSQRDAHDAEQVLQALRQDHGFESKSVPVAKVCLLFKNVGLTCVKQRFGVSREATNVYGVVRSRRGDGTHAMVLHVPWSSTTLASLALALQIVTVMQRSSAWGKDAVLLVTDKRHVGVEAWLSRYSNTRPHAAVPAEPLEQPVGVIEGVVTLELDSFAFRHLQLSLLGYNGRAPNLDYLHAARQTCLKQGLSVKFIGEATGTARSPLEAFYQGLSTFAQRLLLRVSGQPTGAHGVFLSYSIDAVTIKTIGTNHRLGSRCQGVGQAVEGLLRVLNNISQKLHHSHFFYVLLHNGQFLAHGDYLAPLGLVGAALVLLGASLWWQVGNCRDSELVSWRSYRWIPPPWAVRQRHPFAPAALVVGVLLAAYLAALVLSTSAAVKSMAQSPKAAVMASAVIHSAITATVIGRLGTATSTATKVLTVCFQATFCGVAVVAIAVFNFPLGLVLGWYLLLLHLVGVAAMQVCQNGWVAWGTKAGLLLAWHPVAVTALVAHVVWQSPAAGLLGCDVMDWVTWPTGWTFCLGSWSLIAAHHYWHRPRSTPLGPKPEEKKQ
eukprot:m.190364 g.190364  ORF g.190364 m.190364 type:complete len:615 (+) comp18228_c0_seq3:67-1911(+)